MHKKQVSEADEQNTGKPKSVQLESANDAQGKAVVNECTVEVVAQSQPTEDQQTTVQEPVGKQEE